MGTGKVFFTTFLESEFAVNTYGKKYTGIVMNQSWN